MITPFRKTTHSLRCFSTKAIETVDVLIVGGGVIGTAMAASLQSTLPELSVRVLEAGPCKSSQTSSTALPHPRSYALSPASLKFLQLDKKLQQLGYYKRMQVWEARQPAFLQFGVEDLPNSNASDWLGAVTEDSFLVQELSSRLSPGTIQYETTVSELHLPPRAAQGLAHVELKGTDDSSTSSTLQCQLLVAADGANSPIRKTLGISSRVHEYGETALTFTVELSETMPRTAFQRFGEDGILALLPTRCDRHAIVVWSTHPERVEQWKQASSVALIQHLNHLLQRGPERLDPLFPTNNIPILSNLQYGAEKSLGYDPIWTPPLLLNTASQLLSFPLQLRLVSRYTAPRVALIGDAAHTVHPMAGQGLNLGLQDVQCLLQHMQKACDAGMDVATFVEQGYEQSRQQQVMATVQGIHVLHQVFHHQTSTPLQHFKALGMNLVQNVAPVRSLLVQAACGGVGR